MAEEDNECPICGQPYDHKREVISGMESEIRADATECKSSPVGHKRTVYVHLGATTTRTVVHRGDRDDEERGLIRSLFT